LLYSKGAILIASNLKAEPPYSLSELSILKIPITQAGLVVSSLGIGSLSFVDTIRFGGGDGT
tara:strand:+ start:71575 stop:71760 length:186 start_codon:yes stop_codon:yes gene_type:complete